jgi:hypothetical protein
VLRHPLLLLPAPVQVLVSRRPWLTLLLHPQAP